MAARFTVPRDIYFGAGALDELATLKGYKKALIVCGGNAMRRGGFIAKMEKVLGDGGMEVQVFDGVEPDPSVETVMKGKAKMLEYEPDVIVAIGGGSPIDAAKAMWTLYEYPEMSFQDIVVPFGLPELRKKAKFVACGATSGTGTEVTAFAVITDYATFNKYPMADFNLVPDMAIVDTDVAQTMPPKLVASTGMDALTHSIEAYVACNKSQFSDALALQSISDIFDYLYRSYKGNSVARAEMHIAQASAGIAFSNALLGIVHSLAHKTGALYKIPHGTCNAILLPFVIQYNSPACCERFATIAKRLGLPGFSDQQLCDSLVQAIKDLNARLGIAQAYKDHGVTAEKYAETREKVAKLAMTDACTGSNPRAVTEEEMLKVLDCAYYGEDCCF